MRLSPAFIALSATALIFAGPCRAQTAGNADVSSQREFGDRHQGSAALCDEGRRRRLVRHQHRSLASRRRRIAPALSHRRGAGRARADRRRGVGKVRRRRGGIDRDGRARARSGFHAALLRHRTGHCRSGWRRGELAADHPHVDLVRVHASDRGSGRFGFKGVGILIWFFERHHNEDFGGGVAKGLARASGGPTVAMTQRVTGSFGPRTVPGRIVAIVWMVGSIVTIAVFTASITSVLTIKHLQGVVHGVSDLSMCASARWPEPPARTRSPICESTDQKFSSLQDGLSALRTHKIDALVYEKPLLAWAIQQGYSSSVELVDASFTPRNTHSPSPETLRCETRSTWPCSTRYTATGGNKPSSVMSAHDERAETAMTNLR